MKKTCRRGSAPYQRSDWTSRLWGCPKNGLFKTTRERRALSLLSSLSDSLELWNSSKLRFPFSRLRPPTRAGPLDAHLGTTIGGGLRLCQSRNGATNSTIAEESFPGDVTQQRFLRKSTNRPRETRDKELNSRGKTKPKSNSLLQQQKASNKPTFLILTKPLKFDLNAVTKQRFVRDLFPG